MPSSSDPGRRIRRRVLVAGTVAGLAVASVAGSLVTGASASPSPGTASAAAAPTAAASKADAAPLLHARTTEGADVAVPLSASPVVRRLRAETAARPAGSATGTVAAPLAVTAAAAVTPPAVTPLGTSGVVTSQSPRITFAPDGSRIAWADASRVYSAHLNGSGLVSLAPRQDADALSWSLGGVFLALRGSTDIRVVESSTGRAVSMPARTGHLRATSWLYGGVVVALRPDEGTFELVPLFDKSGRRYAPGASVTVNDAVGNPAGTKLAVWVTDTSDGTSKQSIIVVDAATLANGATVITTTGSLGRPAWDKTGTDIYAPRTEDGVTAVVRHSATTADGAPEVVVPDAGTARYVYLRPSSAGAGYGVRLAGRDAVATSVAGSRQLFTTTRGGSCDGSGAVTAVIAKAGSVEATIAAPLAYHTCGPVLLTGSKALDSRVAAELKRLLRPGRTVRLVGNTTSLSPAVATAVTRLGFKVARYAGTDVYGTAVAVALKGWKDHSSAVIASAAQPLAAVAANGLNVAVDAPLLLTAGNTMPKGTLAYITKYRVGAWAVGSQGIKAAPWATRYAGANDVAVALVVATRVFYPVSEVSLVSAADVSDAYAGSSYASLVSPVMVVTASGVPSTVRTFLDRNSASLQGVVAFASARAVPAKVLADAAKLSGGRYAEKK